MAAGLLAASGTIPAGTGGEAGTIGDAEAAASAVSGGSG